MKGLPNWRIRRAAPGRWTVYVLDPALGWPRQYISLVNRPTWRGAMDFVANVERTKPVLPLGEAAIVDGVWTTVLAPLIPDEMRPGHDSASLDEDRL